MAARMLTLLLVAVPIAAIAADCAGTECPAESDDSVSLLAHRATGAEAGRRRRKCAAETGHVITMDPLGSALSDFSTVMAQGDLEVELVVGSASNVEVTVDSGLQSYVEASVSGGALSIKFTAPCDDLDDDPKVDTQWSVSPHTKIAAQGDSKVEGGSTTTLEV